MKRKQQSKKGLLLAMGLTILPAISYADLYVSPAMRGTISYDSNVSIMNAQKENRVIEGASSIHGEFLMAEKENLRTNTMGFGQNVPLFIAIENIVPQNEGWNINIDDEVINKAVSWKSDGLWEETVKSLGGQNGIAVEINHATKTIGMSVSPSHAGRLAYDKDAKVWRINPDKTLKENLDTWVKSIGWKLDWDKDIEFDYTIDFKASITGDLMSKNGAIDQILTSFKNHGTPLRAVFYSKNKVVVIKKAGFTIKEEL